MCLNSVYYITRNPNGTGLLFVSEINENELQKLDLSFSSFLAIPTKCSFKSGHYPDTLAIKVYNRDHEEKVKLLRIGDDIYWTEIDAYTFLFHCGRRLGRYKGKLMDSYTLVALEPINVKTLEAACKDSSIFFLGEVLKTKITDE